MEDLVSITCYGKTKTYKRKEAINKFLFFLTLCEGAERDRYTNIYVDLLAGEKFINGDR